MKSVALALILAVGAVACCPAVFADQAADEALIRAAVAAYVAAYNRGDAKALAAMWLPGAVYTNPDTGDQVVGRDAIEKQFAAIFAASKETKLSAATASVQFVSPNVAIETGTATVVRPNDTPEETQYAAVYVRRDGKWLLDRVTEDEVPVVNSNYEHLKELEWMIGTWVDGDDRAKVRSTINTGLATRSRFHATAISPMHSPRFRQASSRSSRRQKLLAVRWRSPRSPHRQRV